MADALPPGWVVATSAKTGQQYYFHTATGRSQYDRPAWELPPGWTKHVSKSTGKEYYHHAATGRSEYDINNVYASTSIGNAAGGSAAQPPQPHPAATAVLPAAPSFAASFPSSSSSSAQAGGQAAVDAATALKVASAYDHLQDRGRTGRQSSSILHLKNLNNWVKATLIGHCAPKPASRVLDLACGKLGDLQKWSKAGVHTYCGIDISRQAVEDAVSRFSSSSGGGIQAKIVRADLGAVDLSTAGVLEQGEQFDAISIQFALHYLFQTEQRALTFFRNIAGRLAPGGVFLGTIPDAALLVRKLRDKQPGGPPAADGSFPDPDQLHFGNSIYSVDFSPASAFAQWRIGSHPYGLRYTFYLAESVDRVDEYLVPWELLERLARAVGLEPLVGDNFHDWMARMTAPGSRTASEYVPLLQRMGVLDVAGTLSPEEWEAAGLYRVFAFRAPMTGAVETGELPPMAAIHPEWAGRPAAPLKCRYSRSPGVGDIVDLVGAGPGGVA